MTRCACLTWTLAISGLAATLSAAPREGTPRSAATKSDQSPTLNEKEDGYRGIWYSIAMPAGSEHRYKYSGGLGTYCDYHSPFAVYCKEVDKTFFCYGGTSKDKHTQLLHMVSYYDHKTGMVPRPTLLLDKRTDDAHDNPVLTVDKEGYLWVFSTSHGTDRPSYIHRSTRPYDISEFQQVPATYETESSPAAMDNFSYFQVFYTPDDGFRAIFTKYRYPVDRTACFMKSKDGVHWSKWQRLAQIEQGHYQIGGAGHGKIASMLCMHPQGKGLDWRTNVYYVESTDNGDTWQTADGQPLDMPLKDAANPALVRDYQSEGLLVYIKDLQFDEQGDPVLLYSTSSGHEPGPQNDPRELILARWKEGAWQFQVVNVTDHNYDSASLFIEPGGPWRIITPSVGGPQPYDTGGEMTFWISRDQGAHWEQEKQLTANSRRNHTFARRPLNAHPDFYSLWADGDASRASESRLYFCNAQGDVFMLPESMNEPFARPQRVPLPETAALEGHRARATSR